jgi:hypothetical protein
MFGLLKFVSIIPFAERRDLASKLTEAPAKSTLGIGPETTPATGTQRRPVGSSTSFSPSAQVIFILSAADDAVVIFFEFLQSQYAANAAAPIPK